MNESWADFGDYGNLTLSASVTNYIRSLDNAVYGHAYTSVFGAGTSASEFEFLTGNSMAFLPSGSIPYQQYVLGPTASLASILKAEGYSTLAFHPGERASWQRDRAYPRLGFDSYKCGDDMDVPQTFEHGYVSDQSDFEQIIWELEHKEEGKPLFLFNVTIQNHGGYTVPDYPAQVTVADAPGEYPMAEQYLTLAGKTDAAFRALVEYLRVFDEPTIVIMFGDHQPSVEQGFLDLAYGVTQEQMTMEQYMGKYYVPFVIWANYPLPGTGAGDDQPQLPGPVPPAVRRHCRHPYRDFLWQLREELPALTFVGYTDAAGRAYSHLETNDFTARIEDYQRLSTTTCSAGKTGWRPSLTRRRRGNRRLTKTAAWLSKRLLFGYTGRQRREGCSVTLGQRIQAERKRLGLSQEGLGEALGVTRQAISKWEADGAVPEVDKLVA